MRYVYRDPARLRVRPVHVPEEDDLPAPAVVEAPAAAAPAPARRVVAPAKPLPPKKTPRPLPPPVWGGPLGLELAAAESADLDRRTEALIDAGASTDWVREYKRIRNIK